ncbi:MAG TPA: pyruvate kinase, partial [Syntrophales bacterium]
MLPDHKTKIICTIGPASESPEVLEKLILAGMNIARLNFSHGDEEHHARIIAHIRAAAAITGQRVAILADLPGPKIRLGNLEPERLDLEPGDDFTLTTESITGSRSRAAMTFPKLPLVVKKGDTL